MLRTLVTSSSLQSIGYDAGSLVLEVEFVGGAVYQYFLVPRREYTGLMDADSHGRYFNANIRDRYPFKKLSD